MSTLDYIRLRRIRTWNRRAWTHHSIGFVLPGSMVYIENKEKWKVWTICFVRKFAYR